MTTPTPNIPRLRKLLLKFYQENDPVVLNQGFDISGLVEFTAEKGIDVVNRMLFKKYGKAIDVNAELGTAKQNFNRMSQALTTSTVIVKKEQEFRQKLFVYFSKYNPAMTSPKKSKQMETLVKFAMLNGLSKLSDKLKSKYGGAIEGADEINGGDEEAMEVDLEDGGLGDENKNLFGLDVDRLRNDLEVFYTEMEDVEQLEVLDEMTNWACEIGMEDFDKKLQQLYGTSLNQFNESIGKDLHQNKAEEEAPPMPTREEPPPLPREREEKGFTSETVMEQGIERDFEDMSDMDLIGELRAFYEKHDPDNLSNLEKVLTVARRMGRDALNDNLFQIYEDKLTPLAVTRVVEKEITPPVYQQNPNDITAPSRKMMPTFGAPPPGGVAVGNGNLMAEMGGAMMNRKPPVDVEAQLRAKKEKEEEERLARMPEFMRKALQTKKNNQEGKSKVYDPATGKYIFVNILIDVCKNYRLDVMSGICVCGFAVGDHFYGFKKKGY